MRLIDADSVAKRKHNAASSYDEGWNDAIDAVARLEPTIDIGPIIKLVSWVPCTERLPDREGLYICSYEKHVRPGVWINYDWLEPGVIAWAPFPKPYRGVKNATD